MCGIVGKLSWEKPVAIETVQRMTKTISHRGPDSNDVKCVGPIVLGHCRLSIIDLTEAGNQPMSDSSGRFWIVYNGEVYNHLTIRNELEKHHVRFRSRTDTEVILEAYKKWGVDCIHRFNGMFAFAIWDSLNNRLFLARDRLGKKPLFYSALPDGGVVFASELKALIADPDIAKKINLRALNYFLTFNYTVTDECIIENVKKLAPAHHLIIEKERPARLTKYWDLASYFRNKREFRSEVEAAAELNDLIKDAVRSRLISDVPLGAFLSGGIDSSTIVASMCQANDPSEVLTFTMGFNEKSYSEVNEARTLANILKVHHTDAIVNSDAVTILGKINYHADEPFADTSIIPMYLLSQLTRKHVKVALSGDGGDEIFCGYETYRADKLHHFMSRLLPNWAFDCLYRAVDAVLPVSYRKVSLDYKLRQFTKGLTYDFQRAHFHWRTIFSESEKEELISPALRKRVLESHPFDDVFKSVYNEVSDCHYIDQAMYVDIKTWLVDDILVKVDRATMAHSLEARNPFLDHRIVEFSASLPVGLKLKGLKTKHILKLSQARRLPGFIINRGKRGFNAPVSHWFGSRFRDVFYDLSMNSASDQAPVFNPNYVKKLWEDHISKQKDNSLKLFGLINFNLWRKNFCI